MLQQDYYFALVRVVMASARNNPELRRTIYDLARQKLRGQVSREISESDDPDGSERLQALERAIEQIETDLKRGTLAQSHFLDGDRIPLRPGTIEIISPSQFDGPPYQLESASPSHRLRPRPLGFRLMLLMLLFVGVAISAGVTYFAFQREARDARGLDTKIPTNSDSRETASDPPSLPTPSTYGVYALSNGRLAELEPLPVRVPNGRLAVSAPIATQSTTKLATGRAQFIVFKRDLINSVPENVVVREITHLYEGSAHGSKEATTSKTIVGDAWAIRGVSYEMRVAPVSGNPAMIVIRAADAGFSFPAGRYALVLKGVAYDFSVEPDLKRP